MERTMSMADEIKKLITENDVVLFMKGTADFPQCGFSGKVTQILKKCNVNFKDVNVLDDPGIRQGVKDFTSWPTIPQLYIRGEFIGGCDIVSDLYASGELQKMLQR